MANEKGREREKKDIIFGTKHLQKKALQLQLENRDHTK